MAREAATLTISQVSRRTGIPITTLRFYERELSGLFRIPKTAGGHRRYREADVARFVTVRRLTEAEGVGLSEVRRVLMSRGEPDALRAEVDHLLDVHAAGTEALHSLERRLATLENRIAALEAAPAPRRRWLGRTRKQ
jgi:DNA-binding transcriptional MerR regulator